MKWWASCSFREGFTFISVSGWHALHIHTLIWFTNVHLPFFTALLFPVTSKIHLLQSKLLIPLYSPVLCWFTLLLKQWLQFSLGAFKGSLLVVFACAPFFCFPLNKHFPKMTVLKGIRGKSGVLITGADVLSLLRTKHTRKCRIDLCRQ